MNFVELQVHEYRSGEEYVECDGEYFAVTRDADEVVAVELVVLGTQHVPAASATDNVEQVREEVSRPANQAGEQHLQRY